VGRGWQTGRGKTQTPCVFEDQAVSFEQVLGFQTDQLGEFQSLPIRPDQQVLSIVEIDRAKSEVDAQAARAATRLGGCIE
jgi:hypothetical protein